MRILSFGHNASGCHWIRIKMPMKELAKKHLVFLTDGQTQVPIDGWQIVIFNNIIGDIDVMKGGEFIQETSVEQMIKDFKKAGAKIVYDTDDSQELHPHRHDYGELINKNLNSYFYLLKHADLVTVTTEHLKNHVRQFTKKPIEILPNCIDPSLFKKRKQLEKVKIGFGGSTSHVPDIEMVLPVIKKLKQKHGIWFETLGVKIDGVKHMKPVPVDKYYDALAELGSDIGICPLIENKFNLNKSPLKFLEYTMVGTMCLASNRFPYKGELKPEWLVDDDKWEETLEKFILDKELRDRTLKEQQEWVLANRDIRKEYVRWEQSYRKLIK